MDLLHTMSEFSGSQVSFLYECNKQQDVFSNNAKLYQDILRYSLSDEIRSNAVFKFNDLARWLMKENDEFLKDYGGDNAKTPISRRIASRRNRIQDHIDRLVSEDMVEFKGKVPAARNPHENTAIYNFTLKAKFYALFNNLHNAEQKTTEQTASQILGLIYGELLKSDLSAAVFFCRVLEALRDTATPDDIISLAIFIAPMWTSNVKVPFLDVLMFFTKARLSVVEPYRTAFPKAFRSLDKEARKLLLLQFKLDIEHQYLFIFSDRKWERERLHNFENIDKAIIPIFCKPCGAKFYRQIRLVAYLGFAAPLEKVTQKNHTAKLSLLRCEVCGSDDTYYPPIGANRTLDNKLIIG